MVLLNFINLHFYINQYVFIDFINLYLNINSYNFIDVLFFYAMFYILHPINLDFCTISPQFIDFNLFSLPILLCNGLLLITFIYLLIILIPFIGTCRLCDHILYKQKLQTDTHAHIYIHTLTAIPLKVCSKQVLYIRKNKSKK